MSTQDPLVSIVIACTNNLDITRKCLDSIFSQTYPHKEVIFVDNGSEERMGDILAKQYPDIRIIRLEQNTGFSGGYNNGMSSARGKYIAILNNDAVLESNWIESLVGPLEKDPSVGSISSIILNGFNPDIIDSVGVGIYIDGMSRQRDYKKKRVNFHNSTETLICSGCACMYRKETLDKIGLFDNDFFAYCEDTDLGLRLQWAGYTSLIVPETAVYHFHSMTLGKFSLFKLYLVERNHIWVFVKNFPAPFWLLYPFASLFRILFAVIFSLSGKGEPAQFFDKNTKKEIVITVLQAYFDSLKGFKKMYLRRRAIIKSRRISYYSMVRTILRYRISLPELLGLG